jgi:hypothetical protein
MTLESKNCKACRPKRKPTTKLSAKEIHNKVQSGDMNSYIAQQLRIKQEQTERNKQAMAARKRWLKVWKAELKEALAPVTREIISARNAWQYAREKGFVDKAEFYHEYMGMLVRAKNWAEMEYSLRPRRPPSSRWADYVGDAVFIKVKEMWAVLPPAYKHSGKVPMLIKYRPEESKNAE